ncbi:MAG: tRNA (adenosine(37)-N6)-threonylcarbamoyltransferase complex dimerization subunit type 1 TsaB [Anaerolineales bacterium]|nr:tRNA (adenosine(37)-N6)-threonylcarbamoyltransferase complex dimerization subunit type 1 TsaB [Anaerolineales bacterium]MDW8226946.1 tRNA (adenosine(37)-N6)-threonylcarbamoyltransferase complex dimerization subunit type 1 TsaB [Anaerolineales bacterium]
MLLLAVDTSTSFLGLALYDGVQVLAEQIWHGRARHTQELAPATAVLLERVGETVQSLQALGVALGPGSFTGLRVGLAFVKGLSLARHLPVVGIPTLDIVASAVPLDPRRRLAAVLQAGRGRLALGWYRPGENGWQAEGPITVTTAFELERQIEQPIVVCGELTAEERRMLAKHAPVVQLLSPAQCLRRPALLAELAWTRWMRGQVDLAASLKPIYLHIAGGPAL